MQTSNATATPMVIQEITGPSGQDNLPAEVRLQLTHQLLEQKGFVRVRELSERFGVSTVTARNDLQVLEERRLAHRVHGGAMPLAAPRGERPFEEVATQQTGQKAAIARAAASLVSSGESILVDVGTTTAALAHELIGRTDLVDLTVITNGIKIALDLEAAYPRYSIVVTGGTLRPKQHSLVDPLAAVMLQQLNVDTLFLGCNGLDAEAGVTNINLPEAAIKRTMIAAANRCVVLADSSKLGVRALAQVCALTDIDVVITDDRADDAHLTAIRSQGVDVIVA
ncbi:MAG: hypothetical protein RLZ55_1275 [Actinomycetota bacterium]|jgi:DeoR family transcriptional regulator, aga operon transcriptional repressor